MKLLGLTQARVTNLCMIPTEFRTVFGLDKPDRTHAATLTLVFRPYENLLRFEPELPKWGGLQPNPWV